MITLVRAAVLTNFFEVARDLGYNPQDALRRTGLTRAMLEDPDQRIPAVAAVALLEHTWAVPLTTAIANAGGTPLEETWLAQPERDALEGLLSQSPPQ